MNLESQVAQAPFGHDVGASIRRLSHTFPNGVAALQGLDIDVGPGEFVAVMGPSGCGKSTLLRLIAGLITPTSGEIFVEGRRPSDSPGNHAATGFVFQVPALLPWRTVAENARLPFELDARIARKRLNRVPELLRSVGLGEFQDAYPNRLSGGMRMRAALVRALAPDPPILLLDEPFAALDEITRQELQDLLLALRPHGSHASILVTHNAFEAVYLASRIIVLSPRPGRVVAEFNVPFDPPDSGSPSASPRPRREPSLRGSAEYAALVGAVTGALSSSLS
jgi:NitT/TauT family transport system ATP-binding protein